MLTPQKDLNFIQSEARDIMQKILVTVYSGVKILKDNLVL